MILDERILNDSDGLNLFLLNALTSPNVTVRMFPSFDAISIKVTGCLDIGSYFDIGLDPLAVTRNG